MTAWSATSRVCSRRPATSIPCDRNSPVWPMSHCSIRSGSASAWNWSASAFPCAKACTGVAAVLASIPDRQYQVGGHTDSQPIATERFPTNWHLGSERAISVVEVLVAGGLAPERVSTASYAEFKPLDTNRTKEGRANNRRIEIVVVPDLSTLPGYEELEGLTQGAED